MVYYSVFYLAIDELSRTLLKRLFWIYLCG